MGSDKDQRLSKYLAYAGIASRRKSEKFISEGRVSVNEEIVTSLSFKVSLNDKVSFNGRLVKLHKIRPRIWLYHKPVGEICSDHDPFGKRTVFHSFPNDLGRVVLVGRLDFKSEGLLLLTNNGKLKRHLELPKNGFLRTYLVSISGDNLTENLLEPARSGLIISGIKYAPMSIKILSQSESLSWLEIIISEGKNREIRRVLRRLGLNIKRLKRIKYGPFSLGKLKPRKIKELDVPSSLLEETAGIDV